MDTQTLKTFLLLAKLKNFTQTAEQLYVAQSTVTNRIADLEEELGTLLFIRNKRSVALTPEGLSFEPYARRILELEQTALQEMNSIQSFTHTTHIGTTNTIYECYLCSQIMDWLKEHPQHAFKITIGHSHELLHALQDSILDLVYCYIPLKKKGISCEVFAVDELILVTKTGQNPYPKGIRREELIYSDYLFCNFALQEVGSFIRELFPPHFQFHLEIDNSTKLIPYLLDIGGISFLPESLARPYLEAGTLTKIPLLDFQGPKISCYKIQKE
ncbi:MAG: LysR family transcriptional regulator [Bacteroides sp.]|nr:LysR family transcriptional regulator [Bacteroides sp.]MCM1548969.1 LysR family transcriptional regulator [Clostridium sp.]